MKNLIFLLFVVLLLGTTISLAQDKKNEPLEKGMFFSSREEAEQAYYSGDFRYYQPDPKNLKDHPPFNAKGLPSPYVALEVVRENLEGSPSWVLLPEGMLVVFNDYGIPNIDGRCHNMIKRAFPLHRKNGEPGINGHDGKDGRDGKDGVDGINGHDGKDGRDGKDAMIPPLVIEETGFWHGPWPYIIGGAIVGTGVIIGINNHWFISSDTETKNSSGYTGGASLTIKIPLGF